MVWLRRWLELCNRWGPSPGRNGSPGGRFLLLLSYIIHILFCFGFFFSYFLLLFFKRRSIFGIRTDTICPCHIQPVERCRVHLLGPSWLYVYVWWRYRWDKSSKLNVLRNVSRLAKHFTIPKQNFHWYVTLLKSRYSHKMQMPLIANAILRCNYTCHRSQSHSISIGKPKNSACLPGHHSDDILGNAIKAIHTFMLCYCRSQPLLLIFPFIFGHTCSHEKKLLLN